MNKARERNNEMLREYDFSQGIHGKYARRYAKGSKVLVLEPDVAKVFPNAQVVTRCAVWRRLYVAENHSRQNRRALPLRRATASGHRLASRASTVTLLQFFA